MFDFDLFVIGGGSGGVRAARMAGATGAKVGLAEESRLGGTCVIRGCVPKKLMLNAADFSAAFEDSVGFGWSTSESKFCWKQFREAKDREIGRLEGIYRSLLVDAGVKVFDCRATVNGAHEVVLADGNRFSAKYILIATGGRPSKPDLPGIEHAICSDDIFLLDELPNRVLLVGGGYIACEFATILNGLGCEVVQCYRGDLILRGFDVDIRQHVCTGMAARGINIRLQTNPVEIKKTDSSLQALCNQGSPIETDMVLYATGRRPNTDGLFCQNVGVTIGRSGEIVVDDYSQTSVPSIFAVGDVTNRVNLTPVAIREGAAFVETIFHANPSKPDHKNVPSAVFTRPEIGTVGLTEEAASALADIEVYKAAFKPLSSVIARRDEKILMKLIVDTSTRKVLGVHLAGNGAAELIQLAGITVKMGATKEDFDRTVAVHPTIAEELVTLKHPISNA